MIALLETGRAGRHGNLGFRGRLIAGIMLVVTLVMGVGLYFALQAAAANFEDELQRDFQGKLDSERRIQEISYAALTEHCRALARRSRIHAALEDGALDLLYPSANDELRDLTETDDSPPADPSLPGCMPNTIASWISMGQSFRRRTRTRRAG